MNEKLKALWWEAQIGYNDQKCDPDVLQKFAELIIHDCIMACKSRVGRQEYNTGRLHCVSDIKDHFGVE